MIRDSDETIQTLVDANQDNLYVISDPLPLSRRRSNVTLKFPSDKAIETSKKNLRDSSVSSRPVSLKHLDELLLLHEVRTQAPFNAP